MQLSVLSLNCENMADVVPRDPGAAVAEKYRRRSELLGALVTSVDADLIGMVEAAPDAARTQRWVDEFAGGRYEVFQGERRGILGLALAVRRGLGIQATVRPKEECIRLYPLGEFDADNDGIREVYSWANRVPHEVIVSGGGLSAPVTFVVIHAKSKGVFIPGDLYAYEQQARAARMKLRAQAATVRSRLDQLLATEGNARVVVLGDMNDSAEFDIYAAKLGGAFLERVLGSVWEPHLIFSNAHADLDHDLRWTIDFKDRVVNPLTEARYGMPTDMRSWIDHILVSPALRPSIVPGTAAIHHSQPVPAGWTAVPHGSRGSDHHPPSVTLDL